MRQRATGLGGQTPSPYDVFVKRPGVDLGS